MPWKIYYRAGLRSAIKNCFKILVVDYYIFFVCFCPSKVILLCFVFQLKDKQRQMIKDKFKVRMDSY